MYKGSNTEKKPWTNLQNSYKHWSKEIKSVNFCYHKVGRAMGSNREKSNIAIAISIQVKSFRKKRKDSLYLYATIFYVLSKILDLIYIHITRTVIFISIVILPQTDIYSFLSIISPYIPYIVFLKKNWHQNKLADKIYIKLTIYNYNIYIQY